MSESHDDYWSAENVLGAPTNSFPSVARIFEDELQLLLINSDPGECNKNLSAYIKIIADIGQYKDTSHHQLSVYAMKLINSNLFIKNFTLCMGKILSLLGLFTDIQNYSTQTGEKSGANCDDVIKEFLCITILLTLKIENTEDDEECSFSESFDSKVLFTTLKEFKLIVVCGNFLCSQISTENRNYVLIKFICDIIFEYLYSVELLSDAEFDGLVSNTDLIKTLISNLLSDVDLNTHYWGDEEQLITYEMFKLLLLINEQYLMKSYSTKGIGNKVFDGLMSPDISDSTDSINGKMSGFMNLLVFHLNREESHIIKILILKFLYLIFTSSYTSKLYYLNDLKILIDIFVRELNDLEYVDEVDSGNRVLIFTYLKVLYPMLMYSQLSELKEVYKADQLLSLLSNIILNCTDKKDGASDSSHRQLTQISELAKKCMKIDWINRKKKDEESRSSSSTSLTSLNIQKPPLSKNSSEDSIANSFTRVASVRASSRSDYHLQTTFHNVSSQMSALDISKHTAQPDLVQQNNGNIFFNGKATNSKSVQSQHHRLEKRFSNILDLPNEYLKNETAAPSKLTQKAMKKRPPPPPPPPPPHHTRRSAASSPSSPRIKPIIGHSARTLSASPSPAPKIIPPPPPPSRRR